MSLFTVRTQYLKSVYNRRHKFQADKHSLGQNRRFYWVPCTAVSYVGTAGTYNGIWALPAYTTMQNAQTEKCAAGKMSLVFHFPLPSPNIPRKKTETHDGETVRFVVGEPPEVLFVPRYTRRYCCRAAALLTVPVLGCSFRFFTTMVRKKVDARVRSLIENGVKSNHRSTFVLVGDHGKDQASRTLGIYSIQVPFL